MTAVSGRPEPRLSPRGRGGDPGVVTSEAPARGAPLVAPQVPVLRRRGVVRGPGRSGCRGTAGRRRRLSVGRRVRRGAGVPEGPGLGRRSVGGRTPAVAVTTVPGPVRRGGGEPGGPHLPPGRGVPRQVVAGPDHPLAGLTGPTAPHPHLLLVREVGGVAAGGVTPPPTVRTEPVVVRPHLLEPPRRHGAHHLAGDQPGRALPDRGLVHPSAVRAGLLHLSSLTRLPLYPGLGGVQGGPLEDELDIVGVLAPLSQDLQQER